MNDDNTEWIKCSDRLPAPDADVETKIDDGCGVRNEARLRRHSNLWWFTDMSMYVYYSPTHWRPLDGRPSSSICGEKA